MKRWIKILSITLLLNGCGRDYWRYGSEGVGIRSEPYPEPAPYGMVLIPKGSIRLGNHQPDPLSGLLPEEKWASFDAFWMDETEVTNARYRQFVYWVRDSIIRERLYDPMYGGNELYKITEDRYGEPVKPYLDWKRPIPWNNPTEEEQLAIESIYTVNPVTGEKILDSSQLNYLYEWYDYTMLAKYQKELSDPSLVTGIWIVKDTAYVDENNRPVNRTLHRPLSGYHDFLHTRIINIHPDESCWVTDFPDSNMERYFRHYFHHPNYDNYPVVGVSWDMAHAFCVWRTLLFRSKIRIPSGQIIESFRLPTEAEWEYAARAGKSDYVYPWGESMKIDEKGCFPGNFKMDEGNLVADGHLITSRVRSYPPNSFGLYDMAGNVAEWTASAYMSPGYMETGELNPQKSISGEDFSGQKKRVIKGGSWKDLPFLVRSDIKDYDYQNQKHTYIGFRCVRSYAGNSGNKK